jgi:lysophospholipase L1-like esterase
VPQIDAVTPETRLVTITIGGNDIGYIGGLMAASCRSSAEARGDTAAAARCFAVPAPSEESWAKLEAAMRRIAGEIRWRAPDARILFVDYLSVVPERGTCAVTPLTADAADAARATASRLAAVTARAAAAGGAEVVRASALSKRHHACARESWATGFPAAPPYHPNHAGMTAVAEALRRQLAR